MLNIVESFWKLNDLLKNNLWFQAAAMATVNGENVFCVYTNAKEKQFDTFNFNGVKVIEYLVPNGTMNDH